MTLLAQEENRLAFELVVTFIGAFGLFIGLPLMALYLIAR